MSTSLIVVIAVLYYGSVVWGFLYWWSHDFDIYIRDLYKAAAVGIMGPLTWLIGKNLHAPDTRNIIKKRKK